ncbi:DUF2974 domain-containing protein [Streptobacillus felis]|uniref:DUF2974 domain-containing protein n=1 Tax=Streptobacillus felis TaxID=1384509 RepID=A0A7Z0PFU1_9FUSO|nr:DUF2974 domain-containing protein [Streptobacillus felis]NYV28436.1 DUF2974 domain-containing protein [Streptobacillus felis]
MILEYLKWRGDLDFKSDKFNKIDALILSRLSYIHFEGIIKKNETIVLKNAIKQYLDSKDMEARTIWPYDADLAKLLLKSKRYSKLLLSDYVNNISTDEEKQFSAVVITLHDGVRFVSFRGTDGTVVGWKEDFNMSFTSKVPAQLESVGYLKKVFEKYPENVIIGGHSKGGNLAIYSSIFIDDVYKKKILRIYNFDGPGFNKEILDDERYDMIVPKIETYIPKSSIVGLFLERKEKVKIVGSSKKLIMQHDVYSWNILGKDFIYEKDLTLDSKVLRNSVTNWLNVVDEKQRKEFVDLLFNAIFGMNMSMKEIVTSWESTGQALIKTVKEPMLREMMFKSLRIIYDEYKKEFFKK